MLISTESFDYTVNQETYTHTYTLDISLYIDNFTYDKYRKLLDTIYVQNIYLGVSLDPFDSLRNHAKEKNTSLNTMCFLFKIDRFEYQDMDRDDYVAHVKQMKRKLIDINVEKYGQSKVLNKDYDSDIVYSSGYYFYIFI